MLAVQEQSPKERTLGWKRTRLDSTPQLLRKKNKIFSLKEFLFNIQSKEKSISLPQTFYSGGEVKILSGFYLCLWSNWKDFCSLPVYTFILFKNYGQVSHCPFFRSSPYWKSVASYPIACFFDLHLIQGLWPPVPLHVFLISTLFKIYDCLSHCPLLWSSLCSRSMTACPTAPSSDPHFFQELWWQVLLPIHQSSICSRFMSTCPAACSTDLHFV